MEKNFVYENENIVAFEDIKPAARVHVLFIPREHIEYFADLQNDKVLSSVRKAAQKLIKDEKLMGKGYKVLVNGGGAQIVPHLHFHLIGPIGEAAEI